VVADLTRPILDAEVESTSEHETAADPRSADDAENVIGAAGGSDSRLRERESVAVVDQVYG
jgi:hypothetical protein